MSIKSLHDVIQKILQRKFTFTGSLRDINAPGIIPVDLNAFLHANALALSTWWIRLGNEEKSKRYRNIANEFLRGLQEVNIVIQRKTIDVKKKPAKFGISTSKS